MWGVDEGVPVSSVPVSSFSMLQIGVFGGLRRSRQKKTKQKHFLSPAFYDCVHIEKHRGGISVARGGRGAFFFLSLSPLIIDAENRPLADSPHACVVILRCL